ncbi:MAG: ATP-binding protein [Clostridiales bacterium]|nr:ATP-binding protein [Roseburia sp.]MDD7636947.1 ATP-binding protein [Clostridiales bacterium]MDY4111277.1 ATP-binding protein [Roseburia sp.]
MQQAFSDTPPRTHRRERVAVLKYHTTSILAVILICIVTTTLSLLLKRVGIDKENLLMVSLVGVLLSTVITRGYFYGILTSVLSIFSFNFFFTDPVHTFAISDKQDILLLLFFSIAAVISGLMSSKFQNQTIIARENEQTAQLMYEITESFLNLTGVENITSHTLKYLYQIADCPCRILLDGNRFPGTPSSGCIPPDTDLGLFENGIIYPIKGLTAEIGTVTFPATASFTAKTEKILRSTIYQMALVLDREYIYLEREQIRLDMESEHLKSTLLRSISHDLRTPLTEISGAGNLIADNIDVLTKEEIYKFITDINTETEWLTMTVQNILNMTRISDGRLDIHEEYESMDDLISQTVTRLPASYDHGRLHIQLPDKIILLHVDGNLIVQVLLNLIDNAYKHSGTNSQITLAGSYRDGMAHFTVSDDGCGIAPSILPNIFEGFVTMQTTSSDNRRGVGLGLSICKAIVQAHGGTITAENLPERGACFTILLPGNIA